MFRLHLQKIAQFGQIKTLEEGEVLFREGDEGSDMYIILTGTVEVTVEQDDKRITLALLEPGDFFGEMSLLEEMPRSGTVIAKEPTKVIIVDKDAFRHLIAIDTEFSFRVMKVLSSRIRRQNNEISHLSVDIQDEVANLSEAFNKILSETLDKPDDTVGISVNENISENIIEFQLISNRINEKLAYIQHSTTMISSLSDNNKVDLLI